MHPVSPRECRQPALTVSAESLAVTAGTFGPLPLPSMIPALQGPGLRKHPGVRLDDLLPTSANVSRRYPAPWSTQPACASSTCQDGVVDTPVSASEGRSSRVYPMRGVTDKRNSRSLIQAVPGMLWAWIHPGYGLRRSGHELRIYGGKADRFHRKHGFQHFSRRVRGKRAVHAGGGEDVLQNVIQCFW